MKKEMNAIVYVEKIGVIELGAKRRCYPLLVMKQDGERKFFCSTCGQRLIKGDKYIVESDTERHCFTCLTIRREEHTKESNRGKGQLRCPYCHVVTHDHLPSVTIMGSYVVCRNELCSECDEPKPKEQIAMAAVNQT